MTDFEFRANLLELARDGEYANVEVVLDKGKRCPGHKNILAAASPVLREKIADATFNAARGIDEIQLPEVSMELWEGFVEHIYVDGILWMRSFLNSETLRVAQLLGLDTLENIISSHHSSNRPSNYEERNLLDTLLEESTVTTTKYCLALNLWEIIQDKTYADLIVETSDGATFKSHQNILAALSPYYRDKIAEAPEEKGFKVLFLPTVTQDRFLYILRFALMDSAFDLTDANISIVLQAANQHKWPRIGLRCLTLLEKTINCSNCLAILHTTKSWQVTFPHNFVSENFHKVYDHKHVTALSFEQFHSLVAGEDLVITREEEVSRSILLWFEANRTRCNSSEVCLLWDEIRFEDLETDFIRTILFPSALHRQVLHLDGQNPLSAELKAREPFPQATHSPRERPRGMRYKRNVHKQDDAVFAICKKEKSSDCSVLVYFLDMNKWVSIHTPPLGPGTAAAKGADSKVYLTGCHSDMSPLYTAYDCKSNSWSQVVPLQQARNHHTMVLVRDSLYVFGGLDLASGGPLDSVEVLKLDASSWESAPSLPYTMTHGSAVATGDNVFIMSSEGDWKVCCYHTKTGTSETLMAPNVVDSVFPKATNLNGAAMFVTGYGDVLELCLTPENQLSHKTGRVRGFAYRENFAVVPHMNGSVAILGGPSGKNEVQNFRPTDDFLQPESNILPLPQNNVVVTAFRVSISQDLLTVENQL